MRHSHFAAVNIDFQYDIFLSWKTGAYFQLAGLTKLSMHSTRRNSSHTKCTSCILNTMHIPQFISYTFPVFWKKWKKQYIFVKPDLTILNIHFSLCELLHLWKMVWFFIHLTVKKTQYQIWKKTYEKIRPSKLTGT